MKKTLSFLLTILILNVLAQKGVVIPTAPVTPSKSPSASKPKPVNTAPKPAAGTEIWKVDATSTPCTLGQCMLIKKAGQKEFEIFEDVIEGFDFTEGNTYTIQVRQTLKQPPIQANESIYKYELVKVISSSDSRYVNTPAPSTAPTTNTGAIVQIDLDYGTIACESGSEKQCFLLKEKGRKEYEIFNGCIYGFTYEAGNRYVLQARRNGEDYDFVKVIKKEFVEYNPTKISCVNQRNQSSAATSTNGTSPVKDIPATSIPTSSALDKKWYLRKMKESEGSGQALTTDDNVMWIQISTFNDKLKGFGSCNNFEAVVRTDLVTSFQISKLTSGYVNCGYKKIEDLFYSVLQQADRFEIRNGNLILSKQWKYLMELTSDPNQKEETTTSTNYQPVALNTNTVQPTPVPPVAPSTSNNTTASNVSAASTTDNKEVDDLQKQVEELKKQLEAKKQNDAAEAQKKLEQEKLQQQQEAELVRKAEDQKKQELAELEKHKIAEQKILKTQQEKQQAAKVTVKPENSKPAANTNSAVKKVEVVQNMQTTPIMEVPYNQNIDPLISNDNSIYPDPKTKNRVYYKNDDKLLLTEITEATYRGSEKSAYLETLTLESKIQFEKNKLPKLIIKTDERISPLDVIALYACDFKKEKRQINIRPAKNKVMMSYSEIAPNVYEFILPENLSEGEYAFVRIEDSNNISNIVYNISSANVYCFGIESK